MKRRNLKVAAILLSGVMAASPLAAVSMTSFAAETDDAATTTDTTAADTDTAEDGIYVLMNIPYSEFYASDNLTIDAVTSATKNKPRAGGVDQYLDSQEHDGYTVYSPAAGSYHDNDDGTDISGVTFPVKVSSLSDLDGLTEVKEGTEYSITIKQHGQDETTTYKDADALFENSDAHKAGDHAYYRLSSTPSAYKELTRTYGGGFVFSEVKGTTPVEKTIENASLVSGSAARHCDYELTLTGYQPDKVLAAILHTESGDDFPLRHVANIFRNSGTGREIGINTGHKDLSNTGSWGASEKSAEGQTVTGLTVYTLSEDGTYEVDELTLSPAVELKKIIDNVTTTSTDGKTISVSGIPSDAVNVKASITYAGPTGSNGRATSLDLTEDPLDVKDGKITLPDGTSLEDNVEYTVNFTMDNYSPVSSKVTYQLFKDVSRSMSSYNAIMWAVQNDITSGTRTGYFDPKDPCTRGMAVTFLYKLYKEPAPGKDDKDTPFTDVRDKNKYYYDPVYWAYNNNVVGGMTTTTFGPDVPCTRAMIVQILYAKEGSNKVRGVDSKFSDVQDKNRYYYDAVVWASENGVVAGRANGTFGPNDVCTRQEMVQILYNYNQKFPVSTTAE